MNDFPQVLAEKELAARADAIARRLEAEAAASGVLPPSPPFLSAVRRTLAVYYQGNNLYLGAELAAQLNTLQEGERVALRVYYASTPEADGLLRQIAGAIFLMTGAVILFPRSLAEQSEEEAALRCVHVQLTAADTLPVELNAPLPEEVLLHLRSCADYEALARQQARLLRIDLGSSIQDGLTRLLRTIQEMKPLPASEGPMPWRPQWSWTSAHLPPDLG